MNRRTALRMFAGFAAATVSLKLKASTRLDVFARQNLIAWSIVPFDTAHRGPVERAEMLKRLGITRLAYDGRAADFEHFSEELAALRANDITLQAVWLYSGLSPQADPHVSSILGLLEKNKVRTQLWWPATAPAGFDSLPEDKQFEQASKAMHYLAEQTRKINCSLALYGNGGWAGDPEHQLRLVQEAKLPGVGIVYNFEHCYDHLDRFSAVYPKLVPHLVATNLTGVVKSGELLAVGQGDLEFSMLETVRKSGFRGPIGIINTDRKADAEVGLKTNIDGLKKLLQQMGDTSALKTY
jgi:sugar phosphate isomerase/epimerase